MLLTPYAWGWYVGSGETVREAWEAWKTALRVATMIKIWFKR